MQKKRKIVLVQRPRPEEWELHRLRPHPKQSFYFPREVTDAEIRSLAEDIERNGLQERIEILPDGTIISGHCRWRALSILRRTMAPVTVRRDLQRQGELAIERRLIEANQNRRQLTQLEQVRLARALLALSKKGWERRHQGWLMDEIGKKFGLSGKHLRRLFIISDLPLVLQSAYESREITQRQCLDLAKLGESVIQVVAREIESGRHPRSVVSSALQRAASTAPSKVGNWVAPKVEKLLLLGRELMADSLMTKQNLQATSIPQLEALGAFLSGLGRRPKRTNGHHAR